MKLNRHLRRGDLRYLVIAMVLLVVCISVIVPKKVEIVQAHPYASGELAHELQGDYYRGIFTGRDLSKRP